MTNVLKHSDCSKVILSFKYHNDILEIKLVDNGKGMSKKDMESQNGLAYMKARAQKINCELQFISKENEGTTVYFKGKTT